MFVEGGKFDDHLNPIENSQMYKVVDSHINAVNLIITLPSLDDVEREKSERRAVEEGTDPFVEPPEGITKEGTEEGTEETGNRNIVGSRRKYS